MSKYSAENVKDSSCGTSTGFLTYLEYYLNSDTYYERTPILLGMTAVAKSALVKSVTKSLGKRLVDIRCAFVHRLDFEGLTERKDIGRFVLSYNAPQAMLFECTDEFIDYCVKAAILVEKRIEELKAQGADVSAHEKVLAKFKQKSKHPVLLFDEITRSDVSIRNALMRILNEKKFLGFSMRKARVICASNYPVGLPADVADVYLVENTQDVAFNDRFEPIIIEAEKVFETWLKWGAEVNPETGSPNLHPKVREFLTGKFDRAYAFGNAVGAYRNSGDFNDLSMTPFPNYRSWFFVSEYLRKTKSSYVSLDFIMGLVGHDVAIAFCTFLRQNNYRTLSEDGSDWYSSILMRSIETNTPVMMVAPTSFGKTTRLKQIKKKLNAEMIEINLALQDRVDIMGPPVKVSLVEYVVGAFLKSLNDQVLVDGLTALVEESSLPAKVTVRAPKAVLVEKIKKAVDSKRRIIIFFDEMNRVNNEALMSAVFECISDNRIFGIDYSRVKDLVSVVAACNVGSNFEDAKSIDPAFTARFNILSKQRFSSEDVRNLRQHMADNNYHRIVKDWIGGMAEEEVLELIGKVEKRSLEKAVPSMRAFSDLSRFLQDPQCPPVFKGVCLFQEPHISALYSSLLTEYAPALKQAKLAELCDDLRKSIDKWVGLTPNLGVKFGKFLPTELVSDFKDMVESQRVNPSKVVVSNAVNLIVEMFKIDWYLFTLRKELIFYILGDSAEKFCNYHNLVALTVGDAGDISNLESLDGISSFLSKRFVNAVVAADFAKVMSEIVVDMEAKYGWTLPVQNMERLLLSSFSYLQNNDAKVRYLKLLLVVNVSKLVLYLETKSANFSKELLKQASLWNDQTKEQVEASVAESVKGAVFLKM